jgi:hypothetical protein
MLLPGSNFPCREAAWHADSLADMLLGTPALLPSDNRQAARIPRPAFDDAAAILRARRVRRRKTLIACHTATAGKQRPRG